MSKLTLLLCSILLMISVSCATCPPTTFNKAVITNTSNQVKVVSSGQKYSILNINDELEIAIGECHPWNNVLCAVITPKSDVKVRFENNEFIEFNSVSGKKIATHTTDLISYSITCHTKKNSERICNSTEESPTNSPTTDNERITEHRGSISEVIFKTFDSKLEFVGATDSNSSLSSPTVKLRGNRDYKMLIIQNINLDKTSTTVKFPRVSVNGRIYDLPDIKLTQVTESVCHYLAW